MWIRSFYYFDNIGPLAEKSSRAHVYDNLYIDKEEPLFSGAKIYMIVRCVMNI